MKFYYNDKLIRTSKTHVYSHAVINTVTGRVIGCRSTLLGAQQLFNSYISEARTGIENAKRGLKAVQAGKKVYESRRGNRTYWDRINKGDDEAYFQKWIDSNEAYIERISRDWKVVPLEAREK